jgi:hypothetical protein
LFAKISGIPRILRALRRRARQDQPVDRQVELQVDRPVEVPQRLPVEHLLNQQVKLLVKVLHAHLVARQANQVVKQHREAPAEHHRNRLLDQLPEHPVIVHPAAPPRVHLKVPVDRHLLQK